MRTQQKTILAVTVCLLSSAVMQVASAGQAVLVNLTDKTAYVARMTHERGSGDRPDGWRFVGWQHVKPGEVRKFRPGYYFVKGRNKQFLFRGSETKTGLVRHGDGFERFVAEGDNATFRKLYQKGGYTKVTFQHLKAGVHEISVGKDDAYRISFRKGFRFDFKSLSPKFHPLKTWSFDGNVVAVYPDVQSRWAKGFEWIVKGRKVSVFGFTEGKQVRPFGPREPGYYRGTVKVEYVARR
jgi:hypothetical protein